MKTANTSVGFRFHSIGFAATLIIGLSGALSSGETPANQQTPAIAKSAIKPVTSKLGYVAVKANPSQPEEGAVDTVIKKDGKEVARIPNARPVSFSPDGGILLLAEAAPDDDCRHFLLNVADGEKPKPFGKRHRIGGRYVEKAEWSKDGKTITFTNNKDLSDTPVETITVADQLTKGSANKR